jgi:DNA-binding beta-propeller fold protein YncE
LSREVLGTFDVGTQPLGIAFDGANMWVANHGSNNVTELSLSREVLGTFDVVGTGPWGVAFDGAHVWVATQNASSSTGFLTKL